MADKNKGEVQENTSDSDTSIVEESWGLISSNTEILAFMVCGVITTIVEIAGYWPKMKLTELFPEEGEEVLTDFRGWLYKISDGADAVRFYSAHIYLAAYILLPYPLLTEKQKVLLTPWLLCGVMRSILLNLVVTLAGMVLCALHSRLHFQCIKFCALHSVEFCISLFVWSSVHGFYHFLDSKKHDSGIEKVMKTIHKAGMRKGLSDDSGQSSVLSISKYDDDDDEDDLGTEATMVERAAMAWIAREILENGAEYVTDSQFSQYLAIKATMELRQIVKELVEKKKAERNINKPPTKEERLKDCLEYARQTSKQNILLSNAPDSSVKNLQVFEQSQSLSKRDPLLRIPPLVSRGKPFLEDDISIDSETRNVLLVMSPTSSEQTVEVQTDPVTPGLQQLFDVLEKEQVTQETHTSGGSEIKKDNDNISKQPE